MNALSAAIFDTCDDAPDWQVVDAADLLDATASLLGRETPS